MRFALMVITGVFGFSVPALADGGFQASVEMPVSVRILDFKTTKQICGGIDAPSWCPAHLLISDSDEQESYDANDARQRLTALESAERIKRRRTMETRHRSDISNTKM